MLKTAIPYMRPAQKRQFAILVKYMELQRAAMLFSPGNASLSICEVPPEENNTLNLLSEMRQFATPKELETLDMVTNFMSMLSLYSELS